MAMTIDLLRVTAADADTRLDRWLRRQVPNLPQGLLQKLLRSGQIRVDGKRAEANTRLAAGQQVRVPPLPELAAPKPPPPRIALSPAEERDLLARVLHRDAAVIALDKPQGLPVQGGPGITRHLDAMLDALRFGSDDRPRLVHRLDRDTSGVLLLARTAAAAARLAAAFRGRDAEKTYWAVTIGRPTPAEGRIDMPLAKRGGPRGERTTHDPEGVRAVTLFQTLDSAQKRAALLELRPLTGRTHQLRVHCAEALGCPILGDGKYGGQAAHLPDLPGQLHLHARALAIPHPDGGTLTVSAPLPPHMAGTFAYFGFANPKPHPARRTGA
jgi:23S rRNA pseudouridine955/2504/2580 synthase